MKTVLVANRGEIARRVIRACREAGLGVVAVCSEADREAAHVAEADAFRVIGPAPARDSYLRAEAVLEAAREMGADAIHPGYGFLSENAAFAAEVIRRGLTWIGPDPSTIAAMGDKQRAREIAIAAGVPVVPGSPRVGPEAGIDAIAAAVAGLGWPLLAKASAGGGGIGMREVAGPAQLERVVAAARSMAGKAFGDATLYFERRIGRARHVEVQIFGFGDGRAVALGERDCSLQRRFQKVIEESPAPDLPEPARATMIDAALKLCRAVRYAGAGTVEFILDAETGAPFFLEMNTRIQVEHPVTEMTAGVDLVRMQLDFASGLMPDPPALPAPQGHAIECRIYAEDPEKSFFPAPGVLTTYREPPARSGLRIDAGYREGDEITAFYDPMIAKLIVHGPDREAARTGAIAALRAFGIEGPRTNLRFLVACLEDPDFVAARVDTGFIEQRRARLVAAASPAGASAAILPFPALLYSRTRAMTDASTIERHGHGPRMSQINIHGGETIYLAGQVAKATAGAGIREQTEEILANIDAHLASIGSSKARILQATILLSDMSTFDEMNAAWDAWVPEGAAPARACFEAKLNRPALGVELIVVAAR